MPKASCGRWLLKMSIKSSNSACCCRKFDAAGLVGVAVEAARINRRQAGSEAGTGTAQRRGDLGVQKQIKQAAKEVAEHPPFVGTKGVYSQAKGDGWSAASRRP